MTFNQCLRQYEDMMKESKSCSVIGNRSMKYSNGLTQRKWKMLNINGTHNVGFYFAT